MKSYGSTGSVGKTMKIKTIARGLSAVALAAALMAGLASGSGAERLDRPQRQHHELHGLPQLGRRYPSNLADDAGHHRDHQPRETLDRPAEGVGHAVKRLANVLDALA